MSILKLPESEKLEVLFIDREKANWNSGVTIEACVHMTYIIDIEYLYNC